MGKISNQYSNLTVDQADECFKSALRRIAVFLNSGKYRICSLTWLALTDQELARLFGTKKLDNLLISYLVSTPPDGISGADRPPDDVRAEHEFYGRFQYQKRKSPTRLHVTFNSSEVFREWSLSRLHQPETEDAEIMGLFNKNSNLAYTNAFTNYLVKNFWHNFVHLRIQDINDLNFHEFGGDARDESDFVADNLANIFLLWSYGKKVLVKGVQTSTNTKKFKGVFDLNRCNRVFAERASQRNEQMSNYESFQGRSWRFKRQVANKLSSELLICGAGITDLGVYFSGKAVVREDKRGGYFHDGKVIVRLNQIYYNSLCPPYLEDPLEDDLTEKRKSTVRRESSDRIEQIIMNVRVHYINELKASIGLRAYAQSSLDSIEQRALYW